VEDEALMSKLKEIKAKSEICFSRMDDLLNHNICMVSMLTNVQFGN
jgi:hypothetical protein